INNALMAANIALAQQAFALGDALGIDRDSLGTYLKSASGRSFSLEVFTSLPSLGVFAHGASLLEKDVGLLHELAAAAGVSDALLSAPATALFRLIRALGETQSPITHPLSPTHKCQNGSQHHDSGKPTPPARRTDAQAGAGHLCAGSAVAISRCHIGLCVF